MVIETEKNLHASVPNALLVEATTVAAAESISLDEFVRDAIERRINQRDLDAVLAFGKKHARARGLTPRDVERAIAEVRSHGHSVR